MKNILIPTDFSKNSHNAIRYALDYFADIPVSFYLLHVASNNMQNPSGEGEGITESIAEVATLQNASSKLKSLIKTCNASKLNSKHKFFAIEEDLNLVEAIRKQVIEKEIDYILMGTRGTSVSSSKRLGSNTCKVITKVKCSIIAIPGNARFREVSNIAFITDYNNIFRSKIFTTLSDNLELHNSALRVLNIRTHNLGLNSEQTDNKGFLHYSFREKKHSFHFVENKELEAGLKNFIETWDISMVSIVAKNLNFIERLLLRPVGKLVSYEPNVPFLVIHE
ncbi:universal stress protein [Aequorivita sediminis]|uniref:universal stress protein n=1 Tax=Aequorivita sediminis TaxID=3073653 RepID=UPI0028AD8B9E|nr:universal stress protein [Aequorivita sp. F6058]